MPFCYVFILVRASISFWKIDATVSLYQRNFAMQNIFISFPCNILTFKPFPPPFSSAKIFMESLELSSSNNSGVDLLPPALVVEIFEYAVGHEALYWCNGVNVPNPVCVDGQHGHEKVDQKFLNQR